MLFLLACGGALLSEARAGAEASDENRFALREPLGQAWENDLVTFDFPKGAAAGGEVFTLLGADEKPQPFQGHADSDDIAVSFLTALPAYGEASYRLIKKASTAAANQFTIEQGAATIQITNGITGIEVPTAKGNFTASPIGRVRLRSGRWVGKSLLADVPMCRRSRATTRMLRPRGRFSPSLNAAIGLPAGRHGCLPRGSLPGSL